MYQQRSSSVEKYLEYIAQQEEKFSNALYNAINEKNKMSKDKIKDIISKIKKPKNGFEIKIKEYKKHKKEASIVIKKGNNVEDIYNKKITPKTERK